MGKASVDKRILQTEAALENALLGLLAEKPLSQITVGELTAAAGINRSTFYLHYSDVSAFLCSWADRLVKELAERLQAAERTGAFPWVAQFVLLLNLMKERQEVFAPLLSPNAGGELSRRLTALLAEPVRQFAVKTKETASRAVAHAYGTMLLHGLVAVAAEWLAEGAQTAPEELSELLGSLSGNETILKKFRELG